MKAIFALKSPTSRLPILDYALYQDGVFFATDLERGVRCFHIVEGLPDGSMLPIKFLKAAWGKKGLTYAGGKINGVSIPETDHTSADMPTFSKSCTPKAYIEINLDDLKGAALAMANQDIRYYLNGMLIDFSKRVVVATDGHRMHVVEGLAGAAGDNVQAIIPAATVQNILKWFPKNDSAVIEFDPASKLIRVASEGTSIVSKVIEGVFPPWERVIPPAKDRVAGKITIAREAGVADLAKFAKLSKQVNRGSAGVARFEHNRLSNDAVRIDSEGISVEGDVRMGLVARYVGDATSFIGQPECDFFLTDAESSALAVHGSRTAVIMPCRV